MDVTDGDGRTGGESGDDSDGSDGSAAYVFAATLQLSPGAGELRVDPDTVDVVVEKWAAPPGEAGWLFFRDALWRGELNDPSHTRDEFEAAMDVSIRSLEFRELRTDEAYLDALEAAIAADLEAFLADDVPEVLTKYLGSRIHVRGGT